MKHIFRNIGFAALALSFSVACTEKEQKPLDSATVTASVEMLMDDETRAKVYLDAETKVLPMIKGETITLGYKATPEDVTYPTMVWSSSDQNVVSIGQDGKMTALAAGNAVITVAPEAMNVVASASVNAVVVETVTKATAISISDKSTVTDKESGLPAFYIGETMQLAAAITPEDATYRSVLWSSSDESIAAIDAASGIATALKEGKVTFTATSLDEGRITETHDMYILTAINPTGIQINAPAGDKVFSLSDGSYAIEYKPYPANSTLSYIQWTSSDESVATVSNGTVKFLKYGSVTITAKCMDSDEALPEGFSKTQSFTMNIPAGFYQDEFSEPDITWWTTSTGGAKANRVQDKKTGEWYLDIIPNSGGKYRGDVKRNTSTYLSPAYPILCFRIDDVKHVTNKGRNITLDTSGNLEDGTKYSGGIGGTNNKWAKKYLCSDGSALLIYDLSTQTFQTGGKLTAVGTFGTFQLKYADIQYEAGLTPEDCRYRMFWFKTFTSEDEMDKALKAWSDETGITYETNDMR